MSNITCGFDDEEEDVKSEIVLWVSRVSNNNIKGFFPGNWVFCGFGVKFLFLSLIHTNCF